MAKRGQTVGSGSRTGTGRGRAQSGNAKTEEANTRPVEQKIVHYAEELGRIVGTMRGRAEHWTGERERLIQQLSAVVTDAQSLLSDLGHRAQRQVKRLASARVGAPARGAGAKTRRKSGKIPKRLAGGPDRKTHALPATTRKKMESRRRSSSTATRRR